MHRFDIAIYIASIYAIGMKRSRYFLALSLASVLALIGLNAFAATPLIKSGSKCSTINSTAIAHDLSYTCIKSGKRLVWSKEVTTAPIEDVQISTPPYSAVAPNGGSDEYRCFLLDPKFKNDAYLQSVTIVPDNLLVSHHGILYKVDTAKVGASMALDAQTPEAGWPCFGDTGIPGASAFLPAAPSSWVSFWAPGANFKGYPVGTGMHVDAGDQFIMQTHFHINSANSADKNKANMKVILRMAKEPVAKLKTLLIPAPVEIACGPTESGPLCTRSAALSDLANRTSDKAALQANGLLLICGKNPFNPIPSPISDCTNTVRSPMKIYGATGHMHQLGRTITITYQSAVTQEITVLSWRPQWDFDNQTTDWQIKPINALPGDYLKVSCSFDIGLRSLLPEFKNVAPNYIVWGEGSRDEMCLAIINYTD